jgi:uncharacterized membrane protein
MPDTTMPPEATPPQISQQEIDSGKTMAILSYIPIAFVGLIVAIVTVSQKNNSYALYHAKQALALYICWAVVALCCAPLIFVCIGFPLLIAANVAGLVLCVLGLINSSGGQMKPVPVVGQFADKWFGKIQKV